MKKFVCLLFLFALTVTFLPQTGRAAKPDTETKTVANNPTPINQTPIIERTLRNMQRAQIRALRVGAIQKDTQGPVKRHPVCTEPDEDGKDVDPKNGGGGDLAHCMLCFCNVVTHDMICWLPGSCYMHVGFPCIFIF